MTNEQILERYKAGETDLKAETAFVFKTQGAAAAFDFARFFDEQIGSEPYLKIMGYIEKLEADAIAPKVNAAEQNRMYSIIGTYSSHLKRTPLLSIE
jgi:hypothetical protein